MLEGSGGEWWKGGGGLLASEVMGRDCLSGRDWKVRETLGRGGLLEEHG